MSTPSPTKHLTEIQILSLLPNIKIRIWYSEARKALQVGLRTTASHLKCHRIYWWRKKEDPQEIVVISKWREIVDFTTSRSYLRSILPHLMSPPRRSIYVNHADYPFSSNSTTNFLTVYFPFRYCSTKFKSQIISNVDSFIKATESTYSNPESLRFVASGCMKETKIIDGERASGFIFCLMWTDRKSEERYNTENGHWRVLIRYLKRMGMLAEEEFHEETLQVLGDDRKERLEFSDEDIVDDDDMDGQLESMRERLKKLAQTSVSQQSRSDASKEADFNEYRNVLNDHEHQASEDHFSIDPWSEYDAKAIAEEDSESQSGDSAPILTPSSSTMSLKSLFNHSNSMNELPGTWKSEYDISCRHYGIAVSRGREPYEDDPLRAIVANGNYQFDSSSNEEDQSPTMVSPALKDLPTELQTFSTTFSSVPPTQQYSTPGEVLKSTIPSSQSLRAQANNDHEKAIPAISHPMRRYGVPKLDPEEELRNAKSRFWRRGAKLSPPSLEKQRATLRDRSPPAGRSRPAQRILMIDPLRHNGPENKRKGSWWKYVRDCLPNPAIGSMTSADVEAMVKMI